MRESLKWERTMVATRSTFSTEFQVYGTKNAYWRLIVLWGAYSHVPCR